MHAIKSKHPPGTLVLPTGELASYTDFYTNLMQLKVPEGTKLVVSKSIDVAYNINQGIKHMQGEWIFIMGHDHQFGPDLLMNLLDHNVDYVSPLCAMRVHPFLPLAFKRRMKDGSYARYNWDELPTSGLFKVAAGSGVALVSKRAVDAVPAPQFSQNESNSGFMGEDLCFQDKLTKAGFDIYVDCGQCIGHIHPSVLWPVINPQGVFQAAANLSGDTWTWINRVEIKPIPEGME